MTNMNYLTYDEITEGDKFFMDCDVQDNRALAGAETQYIHDEPGVISGYGLDYTKIQTKYGEVCVPWQVTGTATGYMSGIYDMIAVGVPVTVDATRVFDKAYPWKATNMGIHIGISRPDQVKNHQFVYNTNKYNTPSANITWSQWCGSSDREVGRFVGKGGWNLRELLETHKIDNTFIKFNDEPDGEKMLMVDTRRDQYDKLCNLLYGSLVL